MSKTKTQKIQELRIEIQQLQKRLNDSLCENEVRKLALTTQGLLDPMSFIEMKIKLDKVIFGLEELKFVSNAARIEWVMADKLLKEII